MESKNYHDWEKFEGNKIPSSLELFDIIFKYLKKEHEILDVGCGFGKTCFELAEKSFDITGVDINKTGIEWAQQHLSTLELQCKPRFIEMDALKMDFPEAHFDFEIWQALLTTIVGEENRKQLFNECCRVLKPGAYIYIAAFGQTWHSEIYYKKYTKGFELSKELGTFPSYNKKTGELEYFAHHYTEKELIFLIREANLKIKEYQHHFFTTRGGNKVNGHVFILQKK